MKIQSLAIHCNISRILVLKLLYMTRMKGQQCSTLLSVKSVYNWPERKVAVLHVETEKCILVVDVVTILQRTLSGLVPQDI